MYDIEFRLLWGLTMRQRLLAKFLGKARKFSHEGLQISLNHSISLAHKSKCTTVNCGLIHLNPTLHNFIRLRFVLPQRILLFI